MEEVESMAMEQTLTADEAIGPVTPVTARRIGLIGDDHNGQDDGSDLPPEVLEAFAGVDLILHLGHMGVRELLARGVLDRLGSVAPVLAVRDYSTNSEGQQFVTPADADRVAGLTRVVEANGLRVGAVHSLVQPPGPSIPAAPGGIPELDEVDVHESLKQKFGGPVDIVAFASTHRPVAAVKDGVLFVNPGSPTYPKGPGRVPGETPGTVGILELAGGAATFEVVELAGLKQ
jgi:putative phosphoesterase